MAKVIAFVQQQLERLSAKLTKNQPPKEKKPKAKAKRKAAKGGKTTKTTPKTKTTITFNDNDEAEIARLQATLLGMGILVKADTLVVRVALRLALAEYTEAEIATLCAELAETRKRGGKGS